MATKPWREQYTVAACAALFPEMSEAEIGDLAADIAKVGLREPVTFSQSGELLDGRCRLEAISRIDGFVWKPSEHQRVLIGDAISFVISKNLMRRNLTKMQTAEILVKCLALREPVFTRQNGEKFNGRGRPPDELKAEAIKLAAEVDISKRTVERVLFTVPDRPRIDRPAIRLSEVAFRNDNYCDLLVGNAMSIVRQMDKGALATFKKEFDTFFYSTRRSKTEAKKVLAS